MPETWANYGIDLHLPPGWVSGQGGTGGRAEGRRADGRLAAGVRLPSSRDLAADLGIAGTRSPTPTGNWWPRAGSRQDRLGNVGGRAAVRPLSGRQAPWLTASADPRYDLRAGIPAVSAFPRRAWLAAGRAALAAAGDQVLGYPDPRGLAELRVALAEYLGRARGVLASPDNVIICSGFVDGLALICRMLASAADRCSPSRPTATCCTGGSQRHTACGLPRCRSTTPALCRRA